MYANPLNSEVPVLEMKSPLFEAFDDKQRMTVMCKKNNKIKKLIV